MKKTLFSVLAALSAVVLHVEATPVAPTFTYFGPLQGATFGGTGIDNSQVAVTAEDGGIFGITVVQRYNNPPVGNDGFGTFTVMTGSDIAHGQPGYAQWNIGFYAQGVAGMFVNIRYDLNPGFATDESSYASFGRFHLGATTWQDSWNQGMLFLTAGFPAQPAFNPDVPGEFGWIMDIEDADGRRLNRTAIRIVSTVNPNPYPVPDKGSPALLLGLSLIGLAYYKWKIA